jgi:alkylhydroperoxidase family enzyme
MARIRIADGNSAERRRAWPFRPEAKVLAERLRDAVSLQSLLPLRIQELVRYRIAQANDCPLCMDSRYVSGMQEGITDRLYAEIGHYRESLEYSDAERVAIEFAERFALDHLAIDEELFERLRQHFDDDDIIEITVFAARHLAFGRLIEVLQLDLACSIHQELVVKLSSTPRQALDDL